MPICRFWLLDINYEVRDHQPEVWLWGIDDGGRRVLIIDRGFPSYFYVLPSPGEDANRVAERIKQAGADLPFLTGLEVVGRRLFGKPVNAVKVFCQDPDLIPEYVKVISKVRGVEGCLEDDIRYSMRYLIDNNIVPCGWHEVEADEIPNAMGFQVDRVLLARSRPKYLPEMIGKPNLKILGFSIICYSPR
ncbi:MAG: 3'-5' exonuclease, partial [Candidatus Bathyarchaeia archaeon]